MPRIAVAAACLTLLGLAAPAQAAAEAVPGELLVRFERGVSGSERADARADQRRRAEDARPASRGCSWSRPQPGQTRRERRSSELEGDSRVAYAEPNTIVRAASTPNDPFYSTLWGLEKIKAPGRLGRHHGQLRRDRGGGRHRRGLRPPRPGQPDVDQLRRDARTTASTTTATATWTTCAAGTRSTATTTRATSRSTARTWRARSAPRATTPPASPAWPRTSRIMPIRVLKPRSAAPRRRWSRASTTRATWARTSSTPR